MLAYRRKWRMLTTQILRNGKSLSLASTLPLQKQTQKKLTARNARARLQRLGG